MSNFMDLHLSFCSYIELQCPKVENNVTFITWINHMCMFTYSRICNIHSNRKTVFKNPINSYNICSIYSSWYLPSSDCLQKHSRSQRRQMFSIKMLFASLGAFAVLNSVLISRNVRYSALICYKDSKELFMEAWSQISWLIFLLISP